MPWNKIKKKYTREKQPHASGDRSGSPRSNIGGTEHTRDLKHLVHSNQDTRSTSRSDARKEDPKHADALYTYALYKQGAHDVPRERRGNIQTRTARHLPPVMHSCLDSLTAFPGQRIAKQTRHKRTQHTTHTTDGCAPPPDSPRPPRADEMHTKNKIVIQRDSFGTVAPSSLTHLSPGLGKGGIGESKTAAKRC